MTLECFSDKSGKSIYYFEGKRISKREAKDISGDKPLPKCVKKTSVNEIKSLKKRIKDILGGRNEYKERLSECDVVRGRYNELVRLIDSASDSVDVMNRVCLTQDVKRRMDEEYKTLENNLNQSVRNESDLQRTIEQNNSFMNQLQELLNDTEDRANNIEDALRREREDKANVRRSLDTLTEECSDRPDLIATIQSLRELIDTLEQDVNIARAEVVESNRIRDDMNDTIDELRSNVNDLNRMYREEMNRANDALSSIERLNVSVNRYETEVSTLQNENDELRRAVIGNENLQSTITELRRELELRMQQEERMIQDFAERKNSLENTIREYIDRYSNDINAADDTIRELEDELEREREECKDENGKLANQVSALRNVALELNEQLKKEKNECLMEVQRAIDGERQITKKQAREFEEQLADLNYKILMCEEAREELEKIKAGGNKEEVKMSKKQMKKAQKKLEKAI